MNLDVSTLRAALQKGVCRLPDLPPSAQAALGSALLSEKPRPQIWVADGIQTLEKLTDCFRTLHPETTLLTLPPFDEKDMEAQSARLKALSFLSGRDGSPSRPQSASSFAEASADMREADPTFILITTNQVLDEKLPLAKSRTLKTGETIDPATLCDWLSDTGYEFDVEVYEKGYAARRGGILDVWPPTAPLPVRIEFFGDEIESLRTFDPDTQRSVEKTETVEIFPLNAKGDAKLETLLPGNTLKIFSNVGATSSSPQKRDEGVASTIEIGHVTSDVIDIDLTFYETNLQPVSELHRPDMAEQQRKTFFQTLEKMISDGWKIDIYMETPGAAERLKEAYLSGVRGQGSGVRICVGLLHGSFIAKQQKHLVITEADIYGCQPKTAHIRRGTKMQKTVGARVAEWTELQPGELVVHVDHGIGKYMGLMDIEMAGRRQEMLLIEYAKGARIYLPTGQAHLLTRYVGMGRAAPALHPLKGRRWQNERASAQAAIEDLAANLLETQATRALKKGRACGPDTHWQSEFENSFPYLETPDQLAAIRAVKADLETAQPMDRLICGDAGYGKTEVAMRAAFKMVMEGRQVAVLVPTTVLAQQHFDTFTERMAAFPVAVEMLSRFRTRGEQNETIKRLREGKTHIVIGTHRLVSGDVQFENLGLVVIDEEQRFGVRAKEHLKQLRRQVDVLTLTATPIPRTLYMSLTGGRDMSTIQTPPQERQPVETIVLEYHEDIVREAILHELARDGQVFYLHNRVQTIGKIARKLSELVPEARIEYAHGQMGEKQLSDVMHRFVQGQFDILLCTTIIESGMDIPRVNTIIIDRADRFGLADLYQLRGRVGRARHKAYAFLLLPRHGQLFDRARRRIEALKRYTGHGTGFRIAMRDLEIRGAGNLLGAQQSGHIAAIGFDLYCQLLKRSVAKLQGRKVPPVIDAAVDLDFLNRSPSSLGKVTRPTPRGKSVGWVSSPGAPAEDSGSTTNDRYPENAAFIPYDYVEDENLRVKLYGRIASLATESEVRELKKEFADRFGALPAAVKNLFEIARIRIAAAQAGVQSVRVSEERIILTRNGEAVMPAGRYPRLKAEKTGARLRAVLRSLKNLR